MRIILLLVLLQLLKGPLLAQTDSCWTVLLLKKGNELEQKEDMGSFSETGFYLYRNCVYQVEAKNGYRYSRLIDIKPDTLFFTNFFNRQVASKAGIKFDTVAIHYKDLDKLRLVEDRSLGIYSKQAFDRFDFIFKRDTSNCSLQSERVQIFKNDPRPYELAPHLTGQGINLMYEERGRTYFFYGTGMVKNRPDWSKKDETYDVRNVFWLTPCKVEKINGLALGVFAENIKNNPYDEKDSLEINGVNIEINPFALFTIMNPRFVGPYADNIEFYDEHLQKQIETTVNGINISLVNSINETELNGVNITGVSTIVDNIDGFSLSGLSNFAYRFNGLSVAGLYNRATMAKGIQIALVNKSTNMRGVQIGLWNINGKRALPLINWQFSDKE